MSRKPIAERHGLDEALRFWDSHRSERYAHRWGDHRLPAAVAAKPVSEDERLEEEWCQIVLRCERVFAEWRAELDLKVNAG